jgi:trk system potassium uptake protein TrkA
LFILIVGGGKVGTYLARALLDQNHEVVVIEKQARKAETMASLLERDITIVGDGCDPMVLASAGLKRADVVVADTGDDEDNLVVCLVAKKQANARCIARVNNPKNKAIFESIDPANPVTVISSTEIILDTINEHVNVRDYAILTKLRDGDLELIKMTVGERAPSAGKRIVDIALPRSSLVVAVERKGSDLVIPDADTKLRAGDQVILMVHKNLRDEVRSALVGANGQSTVK